MNEYKWPENVHMVTLSPNGRRVYGTSIDPFSGLLVLDISDMARPKFLGRFGVTRQDGTTYEFAPHEAVCSVGWLGAVAGFLALAITGLNSKEAELVLLDRGKTSVNCLCHHHFAGEDAFDRTSCPPSDDARIDGLALTRIVMGIE